MKDTKIHTAESITSLLNQSDDAVDRAMLRINDNFNFIYQRWPHPAASVIQHQVKNFAWFIRGQDSKDNVRWDPKSLAHPIADRQLKKFYIKGGRCIDTARRIALGYVEYLVKISNKEYEKESALLSNIEWPEHIQLGRPSQKRYGDRYEYDAYLKSLNKQLPPSSFPVSFKIEKKQIGEILRIQEKWRNNNQYSDLSSLDPQHIIDRYDFWKKTYCYLD